MAKISVIWLKNKLDIWLWLLLCPMFLAACQNESPIPAPTLVSELPTLIASPSPTTSPSPSIGSPTRGIIPPTFTSEPIPQPPSPTIADLTFPTVQPTAPLPTNTPTRPPTETPTLEATFTPEIPASPTPEATATPNIQTTPIAPPTSSRPNLLPNPSFEEGWYHFNGIPELQIPNRWTLEWQVGLNELDPDPWNSYFRPESRLLNGDFLPASEHAIFIWDGDYTVKIFKKTGALHFRLTTNVDLDPGTYLFRIHFFPDLIDGYLSTGEKVWAPDPLSGEVQFILDDPVGSWHLPSFGQKNSLDYLFDINETRLVRIGVAFRGRWAIENNGWFMDDWSLQKISEPPSG